jgi:hypothetical protein
VISNLSCKLDIIIIYFLFHLYSECLRKTKNLY